MEKFIITKQEIHLTIKELQEVPAKYSYNAIARLANLPVLEEKAAGENNDEQQ